MKCSSGSDWDTNACEPLIQAAMDDIFGLDVEQGRRRSFRSRLQHDMGWYLKSHPAPKCMFD